MLFFAINKNDIAEYIEAEDWDAATAICICNDLALVGEVTLIIDEPEVN